MEDEIVKFFKFPPVVEAMDLTIYIQSGGMSTAFALSLDLLPHQLTAIAHVNSVLQMCSTYAESRPSQKEAHQQLKSYMDKVNLVQTMLVNKQRRRTSAKRSVRPMPVILDGKGDYEQAGLDMFSDEESTVRPIAPHRQKAQTAPAADSEPLEEDFQPVEHSNDLPSSSPRGSSNSLDDLSPEVSFASGRQVTDDVNREQKDQDKVETQDPANPMTTQTSGRSLLPSAFRWKMPSATVSWVWNKKSGKVAPDDLHGHGLVSQATAIVPSKTLE